MKRVFLYSFMLLFSMTAVAAKYSQMVSIQTGGKQREAFVYVPDCLTENRPLVISAHGMGDNVDNHKSLSQWEQIADTANFVVVYPQGEGSQWDISGMKDINFMLDIIKKMSDEYEIDESRIYMTGFSMGGMLTYHIINNVADKFAAFGPISGYNLWGANFNSSRPVPICHIHGKEDSFVSYDGVPAIIKGFANKNNCDPNPEVAQVSNVCEKMHYKGGDCGSEVIFYSVRNRWHELTNKDFHTTKALWDFFRKYMNECDNAQGGTIDSSACEESVKKNIYEVECSSDFVATTETLTDMSGSGVLNLKEEADYVNISVSLAEKGAYKVYVGYNSVYGFKQIDCAVNGVSGTANLGLSSDDEKVDKLAETLVGSFDFSEGENEIRLTPIWTWAVVDYVRIEKDENAHEYEYEVSDVDGFKVSGNKLLDRCNQEFVMRGVNMAYTWYKSSALDQLKAINNSNANAVRIVLTNGIAYGTPADDASEVKSLIEACRAYGMVAILEVHDVTGSDKISDLEGAARYFANIADVLKGTEASVIINIANEWHNSSSAENWRDGYLKAIPIIRNAGLRHCIMVDAGGYGQSAATIHSYGKNVLAADPENNVIFSIHMYGTAGNKNRVKSNIDGVINQGLALCIGEFGWYHSDGDVDEDLILSYCQEKKVGWLAWSWYGNGNPVQYLDLVKDASASPVLAVQSTNGNSCEWGKKIVEAWEKEAERATFDGCLTSDFNEVAAYDDNEMLYYDYAESVLHVNAKSAGVVQIYSVSGVKIDAIKIVEGSNKIKLNRLPQGVFIAFFRDLTVKITR